MSSISLLASVAVHNAFLFEKNGFIIVADSLIVCWK